MGLKVKMIPPDDRSAAQIEEDLLAKDAEEKASRAESYNSTPPEEEVVENTVEEPEVVAPDITNDNVLSFIEKETGNKFGSIEEMLSKPEPQVVELDDSVAAYKEYRERTGRSIQDFVEANKDFSKVNDDDLLRRYYTEKNEGLDQSDINLMLNDKFSSDEFDEDIDVQRKNIAKKLEVTNARKHYEKNKEQYGGVLESTAPLVSEEKRKLFSQWEQQQQIAEANKQVQQQQRQHFQKSTNDLFSNNFEGFDFNIGDNKNVSYKVDNVDMLKERQLDATNFIKQHFDDKAMLKDPKSYHKAMLAANDPDGLFKFAYEQGKADAVKGHVTDAKNISMKPNNANNETTNTGGFKVTAVNSNRGKGGSLKINLPNNK
tara:strand:- start:4492 stop:5613 length:1122 start_codon:yes stop_codon:yes gene_type:complete